MHAQPCGLEVMVALGHDFVLRRNLRIMARKPISSQDIFIASTFGSHHLALISHVAKRWNALLLKVLEVHGNSTTATQMLAHLPQLLIIDSGETFGLVASRHNATFGGLLQLEDIEDVKEDPEDAILGVDLLNDSSHFDIDTPPFGSEGLANNLPKTSSRTDSSVNLGVDGQVNRRGDGEVKVPVMREIQHIDLTNDNNDPDDTPPQEQATEELCNDSMKNMPPETTDRRKRSAKESKEGGRSKKRMVPTTVTEEEEGEEEALSSLNDTAGNVERGQRKRARMQPGLPATSTLRYASPSQSTVPQPPTHPFFQLHSTASKAGASTAAAKCTAEQQDGASCLVTCTETKMRKQTTALLPLPDDMSGLTRSQRLFSIATNIHIDSLTIKDANEFFLFMEMRRESKWASFNMTPKCWVLATEEYNTRLAQILNVPTLAVKKNPRALMTKLSEIEAIILTRLSTQNFTCKRLIRKVEALPSGASTAQPLNWEKIWRMPKGWGK
ncbi:unnamed protein product [Somion occarium]|uniref:Uncharacterized protein n=1 Tax=Somion occarium TaxID=3059160 RepID=A0ABP1CXD1_9APHY